MLRALGFSRFAVYHRLVRRPASAGLAGEQDEGFARWLDERWKARFEDRQIYVNELLLTIVRRPLQGKVAIVDRLRQWSGRSRGRHAEQLATATLIMRNCTYSH